MKRLFGPVAPWERKCLMLNSTIIFPTKISARKISQSPTLPRWTAVAQWLRCCATNRKVAGSIPAGVIGFFIDIKFFRSHYGPGVSLYQKWVPGVFPGGKGGRCVRLTTLPPSCAVVMKSGKLNFLEPSGPVQARNETALYLHLIATFSTVSASIALRIYNRHGMIHKITISFNMHTIKFSYR